MQASGITLPSANWSHLEVWGSCQGLEQWRPSSNQKVLEAPTSPCTWRSTWPRCCWCQDNIIWLQKSCFWCNSHRSHQSSRLCVWISRAIAMIPLRDLESSLSEATSSLWHLPAVFHLVFRIIYYPSAVHAYSSYCFRSPQSRNILILFIMPL